MLTNIRNFAITLIVSALIFGAAAYFISGIIVDSFAEKENESKSAEGNFEVLDNIDNKNVDTLHNTYTALIIGTDFTDKVHDYDLSVMNKDNTGFYYKERHVHADSIVLMHFNKEKKEVLISSIPGNMFITYNGVEIKLSDVYHYVSDGYFTSLVSSLTGLHIDNYFTVSLDGFEKIIDGIGGVKFDVPCDMKYKDPSQGLNIDLKAGEQLLNGENALDMLRYVSYSEGNFSRMNVANNFAKALMSKVTDKSYYGKVVRLYSLAKNNVKTNFSISTLAKNLDLFFSYSSFETTVYTYPVNSTYNDGTGENEYSPNTSKAYIFFNEYKSKDTNEE